MMPKGKPIRVEYQTLLVIWVALLMSQVFFLILIWFIKPGLISLDTSFPFLGDKPLIILAFGGSALVFFFLSQVLSRQHIQRAIQDQDAGCVQTGLIIGCALAEISSILGLILALAFDYPYFYLWIALGIFGVLLNFPRKGSLDAATYKL
jgi:F0F1-type ATP synthase membrane subunit c/vacuolar-type H+-ATPase subunit K